MCGMDFTEANEAARIIAEHYGVPYTESDEWMDAEVQLDSDLGIQVSDHYESRLLSYYVYRFDGAGLWYLNPERLDTLDALYDFIDNELPKIGK